MTRLRFLLVLLGAAALAVPFTACSSKSANNQVGDTTPTAASGSATCTPVAPSGPSSVPVVKELPAPPPGSELCTVSRHGAGAVYYKTTGGTDKASSDPDLVFTYYRHALESAGCRVGAVQPASHPRIAAGDREMQFTCPDGSGLIVTRDKQHEYVVAKMS